jgi:phosphatidylserine decarboxylase
MIFFARELKEGCRPKADADIISPADCRVVVYQRWEEGNKLWLKGQKCSVEEVLGPELSDLAKRFSRCSIAIFRLAPNDYHRWHLPFRATLGPRYPVKGEYYSVSPRAVTNCNVFGRNKREVCVLESDLFGTSLLIPVGAAGVGGINIVGQEKVTYEQGAEHGFFTYGGSTLLMLFEENSVIFDEDLLNNSHTPIETLIRMGERIGRGARKDASLVSIDDGASSIRRRTISLSASDASCCGTSLTEESFSND